MTANDTPFTLFIKSGAADDLPGAMAMIRETAERTPGGWPLLVVAMKYVADQVDDVEARLRIARLQEVMQAIPEAAGLLDRPMFDLYILSEGDPTLRGIAVKRCVAQAKADGHWGFVLNGTCIRSVQVGAEVAMPMEKRKALFKAFYEALPPEGNRGGFDNFEGWFKVMAPMLDNIYSP